ncbi:putative NADP-dependent alcohol dehydrogenase C 2 [Roridomyces roridus]|uniref:NADP-dependent alcohol dehydrogenase C 2 n=1 Tax=Roridomyces roridus TaxID=1738132 RepID=A0AAD7CEW0_9AGAR|nr:putative NADP-dependent alcohol dehydrogenase C 2 [Roridomyces roridus]
MTVEFTVFKGSANTGIVKSTTRHAPPTGNQVQVRITHSGVCGTDEHYKHLDMVLGHEGVGIVEQIGDSVKDLQVGDVVGWGYVHKVCGRCEECSHGEDQYCSTKEEYGLANQHQGSFGSRAIWDADILFKIPAGLKPEHAAPLMCAGATIFGVLESFNVRPTDRVGVVGIGGVGHMAILFLAKMGASVVVFSSTESKRGEALRLGASEFHSTAGADKFDVAPVDHLIVATSFLPNWEPYMQVVKRRGTIYPLTLSFDNLLIPQYPLLARGLNVQGSIVASRSVLKHMLDFSARNQIKPVIECFPLTKSGIEESMARLGEGKIRYRAVLVAEC